jgi:hypothetical protein
MATLEEMLSGKLAALDPEKQSLAMQILGELSEAERTELSGLLSLSNQQSSSVQTGMPVMTPFENEAQQLALQQSQRQSPTNYLDADPMAVVGDRFMEQVGDPALKMGLATAGGFAGGALVGGIPAVAALADGGLMARQGFNLATTIGANLGAQAPLLGYEMVKDIGSPGDDPNIGQQFYDNVVPGLDSETALNYGFPMLAGAALGEGGRWLSDKANRPKYLAQSFSQNPANYIDAPGNMPVPDAVARVQSLPEDVLNPSVLSAQNPFGEIDRRLQSVQGITGQRIGSQVESFPDTSAPRLNPSRVIGLPDDVAATGTQASTVQGVLNQEMPAFESLALQRSGSSLGVDDLNSARKAVTANEGVSSELGQRLKLASQPGVLAPDEFFEYQAAAKIVNDIEKQLGTKKVLAAAGQEVDDLPVEAYDALASAHNTMDHFDTRIRQVSSGTVAEAEQSVRSSSLTGPDVLGLKRGYDKAANYEKQALNTPRQELYGQLGDNARAQLYQQANRAGKLEPFEREMRKFEGASTLQPMAAQRAAEMQARAPNATSEVAGIRTNNNLMPTLFARGQNFFQGKQTPEALLRKGLGQKWTQRMGGGMEQVGQVASPRNLAVAGNVVGTDYTITGQLGVDVDALKPLPTPPMNIPRSVPELMRSPDIVGQLIQEFSAPDQALPRYYQWQRAVSSGDKTEMARFMADMSKMSPDFPLARGQITGLPSEFDIGDGFARLFSEDDKVRWESTIESSQIGEDEKALRLMALRKHSIVMPFGVKLNKPVNPPPVRQNPDSQFYQYNERDKNPYGSRKVEE